MGESYSEVVIQKVKQVTEEYWNEQNALDVMKEAEQAESLTNPLTPYDFTRFIEQKGQDALSNEQYALWTGFMLTLLESEEQKWGVLDRHGV